MEELALRTQVDPITGLCIVTDKMSCPLGYRCLDKSYDQQLDADLWKDKFLGTKKERYLCYTRNFPLANGTLNNVLHSINLINASERDSVAPDFFVVEKTYDFPKDDALKKKLLLVKMVPRFSVSEAICELIVLSGKKTASDGFVRFGELNGLLLCYRKGPVPPAVVKSMNPLPGFHLLQQHDFVSGSNSFGELVQRKNDLLKRNSTEFVSRNDTVKLKSPSVPTQTGASLARQTSRSLRLSAVSAYSVIDDVPFRLNPALVNLTRSPNGPAPPIPYQSKEDIDRKYAYDFSLEKSVERTYCSIFSGTK